MLQRLTFRLFRYLFLMMKLMLRLLIFSFLFLNYLHSLVFDKNQLLFKFGIFPTKQNKEQNIINVNFYSFKGYNSVK